MGDPSHPPRAIWGKPPLLEELGAILSIQLCYPRLQIPYMLNQGVNILGTSWLLNLLQYVIHGA